MANVDYVFSIQNAFPNHKVATDRLQEQITTSNITVALAYIETHGNDCFIWFKAALDPADVALLNAIVAAHSGEPLPDSAIPVRLEDTPKTSDGKPIFLPNLFPAPDTLYLTGAGDSVSGRGDGEPFMVVSSVVEDKHLDFSFLDPIYIAGGTVNATGGKPRDWISLELYAPPTAVTPNGGSTGNCNLVAVAPGVNMIVPAAGDGAYDCDLTAAVPVPSGFESQELAGYWDWSNPLVGRGTIYPSVPGQGGFNLFDVPIFLARFCNRLPLVIPLELTVPAIKPKKILPHWTLRATLHHTAITTITVVWYLLTSRVKTVG